VTESLAPNSQVTREALGSGARGATIGTIFGAAWFVMGLPTLHSTIRLVVTAAGLAVLVLSAGAIALLRRAARSAPSQSQPSPPRPTGGPRFIRVLIVEVVLLAVGNNYLGHQLHRPELMYEWSTVIVGAHFLPLSRTWNSPVVRVLGLALLAVAAVTAMVVVGTGADRVTWQILACFGAATCLWASALATVGLALRRLPQPAA